MPKLKKKYVKEKAIQKKNTRYKMSNNTRMKTRNSAIFKLWFVQTILQSQDPEKSEKMLRAVEFINSKTSYRFI